MSKMKHSSIISKKFSTGILLSCGLLSWIGAMIFTGDHWLSIALSAPGGLALSFAVNHLQKSRQLHFALDQFRWLLEHLSARIASGATLERAFFEAPEALQALLGKKSDVYKCLKRIEMHLEANRPLEQMLPQLSNVLVCREASICLKSLPPLRQAGGNISAYIRRQQVMLSEHIALLHDLSAENAQRQTEAVIMTIMPFVMTVLLRQSSSLYQQGIHTTSAVTAGLLTAYCLSVLAAVMTLILLGNRNRTLTLRNLQTEKNRLIKNRVIQKAGYLVNILYQSLIPESYFARLSRNLIYQARQNTADQKTFIQNYYSVKALYLLAGLMPGIILFIAEISLFYWILILPVICAWLHDQQLINFSRRLVENEQMAYPEFLNMVLVLLQSGLSLYKTIEICAQRYLDHCASTALNASLTVLCRKMMAGMPVGRALSDMSVNCSVPQIQSALLMIERYDRDGGTENLHLLQMQLNVCWSGYRQAARKRLEQRSILLYLPMSIDLVAILLTALLPAMQTLQSI